MNIADATDQMIENKFHKLLLEGSAILNSHGWNGSEYSSHHPSDVDYQRFRAEAMNLVARVCGRNSVHFDALKLIAEGKNTALNSYYLKDCVGILQAAHRDYADGFLIEIRYLIRAELLDDFLSQAEELLAQGFHVAAASIGGAVLEDTLRKLSDKHSIPYNPKTKIDTLNSELAKNAVYDKLVQKEITAKADLRNNADHGHFDKVRTADVEEMLRWIRRFVTDRMR